jgi:hypothetical protein
MAVGCLQSLNLILFNVEKMDLLKEFLSILLLVKQMKQIG